MRWKVTSKNSCVCLKIMVYNRLLFGQQNTWKHTCKTRSVKNRKTPFGLREGERRVGFYSDQVIICFRSIAGTIFLICCYINTGTIKPSQLKHGPICHTRVPSFKTLQLQDPTSFLLSRVSTCLFKGGSWQHIPAALCACCGRSLS